MKLATNRSPRWAFMEKFEIPDLDHPLRNYLTRWRIIQTPWFGVYLHRMDTPDSRPTLHDHPWNFTSLVLKGGYIEERLNTHDRTTYRHRALRMNRMLTHDAHYIKKLLRVPTWTLVFVGRRSRVWGYWERWGSDESWAWTPFNLHPHAEEFDAAMEVRARRLSSVPSQ